MPPRIRALLLLFTILGLTPGHAAPRFLGPPIHPGGPGRTLGVGVSLTTSGYQFEIGEIRPTPGPPGTLTPLFIAIGPLSFAASFAVVNHSHGDITFQVPQPTAIPGTGAGAIADSTVKVIFSVYDHDGKLVWTSLDQPAAVLPQDTVLKAGATWKLTTQVPLQVNGQWLDGDYTLTAAINGTPEFSATAAFRVSAKAPVAKDDVQGQVFAGPISPVSRPGQLNEAPVPKAIVQYQNIASAAPGFHELTADDQGRFSFNVPAGTYTIMATIPGDQGTSFGHGSQTVTVDGVKVTRVTFHLDTGIR